MIRPPERRFDGYFFCGYYKTNPTDQRECPFWRLFCVGSCTCKYLNLRVICGVPQGLCKNERAYNDVCKEAGRMNQKALDFIQKLMDEEEERHKSEMQRLKERRAFVLGRGRDQDEEANSRGNIVGRPFVPPPTVED
jgi:hypothetical protein